MNQRLKTIFTALGFCYAATQSAVLILAVPVVAYPDYSLGNVSKVLPAGLIFTAMPVIIFSMAMGLITFWLQRCSSRICLSSICSAVLTALMFFVVAPRVLFFRPPQGWFYRWMTTQHYLLLLGAILAGLIGTMMLNVFWKKETHNKIGLVPSRRLGD